MFFIQATVTGSVHGGVKSWGLLFLLSVCLLFCRCKIKTTALSWTSESGKRRRFGAGGGWALGEEQLNKQCREGDRRREKPRVFLLCAPRNLSKPINLGPLALRALGVLSFCDRWKKTRLVRLESEADLVPKMNHPEREGGVLDLFWYGHLIGWKTSKGSVGWRAFVSRQGSHSASRFFLQHKAGITDNNTRS